jgi:hypothetical protein
MAKDEAASLALVLSRVGLGVEPDVRFGGPPLAKGPAVLFRLDDDAPERPRTAYLTAATMVHLAASVAAASDIDTVVETTIAEVATTVRLTTAERARLEARLRWLLAAQVTAAGLSRRIAALRAAEREAAGHFLIAVAAAARTVPPATVAALTRTYHMLGLDTALVISRLHQRSIAAAHTPRLPPPAEDPVVVRRADRAEQGHALPWARPVPRQPTRRSPEAAPATSGVLLRQETITRKITETAAVAALLATIFDDEPIEVAQAAAADTTSPDCVGYLDRAHSNLLREFATRASWARADFAALAARHGVLPDGALDLLNEAAIDAAGEPVCEGDHHLTVNRHVLQELLG